jgi:hypothetical protein
MRTYTFHVSLTGVDQVWRKIELRAEQTLEELHLAIQSAYAGKAERFYSFFMSGRLWDEDSEYTLPDESKWDKAFEKPMVPALDEGQRARILQLLAKKFGAVPDIAGDVMADLQKPAGGPGNVRTTRLGSLGLVAGQAFVYLFDYAGERYFTVRVDSVDESADPAADYPRLVESVGEAPQQAG